jgi:hypothetical protein
MHSKRGLILAVLCFSGLLLFSGCAGKTKPDIPDQVPPIGKGMARIVLTREAQLAGAGSPIYIVDTGGEAFGSHLVYTPEGGRVFPERVESDYADIRNIHEHSALIGRLIVGETLIWDRTPGIMRPVAIWHDGPDHTTRNIRVDAEKTYFLHYTTRLFGDRWEVTKVQF